MSQQAATVRRRSAKRPDYRGRLDELRALIPELPAWNPAASADEILPTVIDILERKQRHLIEDNVRLAALRELTETLLRDPDEERVLRTVSLYLRHAYGLPEVILVLVQENGDLRGYRARSGAHGLCEAVRWTRASVQGTVWERALRGDALHRVETNVRAHGALPVLPVILPLRGGVEDAGPASEDGVVVGLLALRPDNRSGAGTGALELEQLAFQAGTLLQSIRQHHRAEGERRFREGLYEAMDDALIALDGTGRITAANPAADRLFGAEAGSLLGEPLERLGARSAGLVPLVRAALSGPASRSRQEVTVGSGTEQIPVNASVVPLAEGEDRRGALVTLSDLRPLRSMEEQLRRLDRLAALGRFASAVAHEIRNPLAAIGAGVQFLASAIPPEQLEHVRFLRAEVTRLDRIVRDLLEPAQTRPLMTAPVTVSELVERACMSVEPLAQERGVAFSLPDDGQGAGRRAQVNVDTDRILQVLVNLLRNAVEAAPGGTEVRISWDSVSRVEGLRVRVLVEDRGAGIAPESIEHLFEPFHTTKPRGTGLGLYVSRSIVERHGGTLQIEAGDQGGTRACVDLPACGADPNKGEH